MFNDPRGHLIGAAIAGTMVVLFAGIMLALDFFLVPKGPVPPPRYHVVCPAGNSRNPMDIVVEGSVWVDRNSWGVIEKNRARTYFWPGSCTIARVDER